MKLGILGGTFDPVHEGHLQLARAAQEQYKLDKVIFVPAFISPHKTSHQQTASAPCRYRMVELAIQNQLDFEVSDLELQRAGTSYTVETLREFQKKYPGDELFLILGQDAAAGLPSWRESEAILKMATVLAAGRPGFEKLEFPSFAQRIEMPECPVSASEIRENLLSGKTKISGVPLNVADYMLKTKLYQKS